jgi:hypothetical protein
LRIRNPYKVIDHIIAEEVSEGMPCIDCIAYHYYFNTKEKDEDFEKRTHQSLNHLSPFTPGEIR